MNPRLSFWGVRGSFPAVQPQYRTLGGNTACLALEWQGHQLILDAGSGIRKLGQSLLKQASHRPLHLLFSHPHWDHVQGFPFFAPLYQESTELHLHSIRREVTFQQLLATQQRPGYFPISLDQLPCQMHFHQWEEGQSLSLGPFQLETWRLNHPGCCSGWRIQAGAAVVAYVSDLAPSDLLLADPLPGNLSQKQSLETLYENQFRLAQGADMVIYDTFFTPEQYQERPHWGHSTLEHALDLCRQCRVKQLFTFHHNSEMTDEVQLQRAAQVNSPQLAVQAAREGLSVMLESGPQ